jgi:hypothetical protein
VVYLIGGPPRCGKSELARRLTKDRALNFIPTDLLWAVLEVALPDWRPPMAKGPDRLTKAGSMFQTYLEQAVQFLDRLPQPYGIEGEVILPETVARLRLGFDLRAVFLVRTTATEADMADARGPNPWLSSADPKLIDSVVSEVVSWSIRVEQTCRRLQIPCFDVGNDFDRALADAAGRLGINGRA